MAISSIHDWLATRGPFKRGVELLKLHGDPDDDYFLFSLPESPFSREKLVAALEEINLNAAPGQGVKRRPSPGDGRLITSREEDIETNAHLMSLVDPKELIAEGQLPQQLHPLRRELTSKWREKTFLRGTLVNMPDGMELKQTAATVARLGREIKAGWRIIEHWRQTGNIVKVDERVVPNDPVTLMKRKSRLEVWLSQHRPSQRKPIPTRNATPEAIAAKEKELEEVKRLIREYTDQA